MTIQHGKRRGKVDVEPAAPVEPQLSEAEVEGEKPESSSSSSSSSDDDAKSSSESSSSSSNGSSSSSTSSQGSRVAAAGKAKAKATAKAAIEPRGRHMGRGFQWGDHLFTPVGPEGAVQHWQVRCGCLKHASERACTKKRSLKFGGEEEVLRLLKYWASLANSAETQKDHLKLWQEQVMVQHQVGNIPTMAELDASMAG